MNLANPLDHVDHVDGPDDAAAELLVYGDFQCPYCIAGHPIVERVRAQLAGELRFAFRHFPLREIHPDAQLAAEASEAAASQGAFWPMFTRLYDSRGAVTAPDLIDHARALELDLERFETELADGIHAERIERDLASGIASGVSGTPAFFVNGHRHDGSFDARSLIRALTGGG